MSRERSVDERESRLREYMRDPGNCVSFPRRSDESWRRDAVNRAAALYPTRLIGLRLHQVFALARLRPGLLDYLEQAPILAGQIYRDEVVAAMLDGARLRDVMRTAGLAPPLRALGREAVGVDGASWARLVVDMHPSALAQAIATCGHNQRQFILNMATLEGVRALRARAKNRPLRHWLAQRLAPRPRSDVVTVCDYLNRGGGVIDLRWSAETALAAAERWHAESSRRFDEEHFRDAYGRGCDDAVDYGTLPHVADHHGLRFVALRSGRALHEEGARMRHCVASYARDVLSGARRIYAVERGGSGVGVATLELRRAPQGGRWTIAQLNGPRNAPVGAEIRAAADAFVGALAGETQGARLEAAE